MPDAIMLSPDTYDRLKRLLDDWDNGFEKTLKLGSGLKIEERGTDYVKIGVDNNFLKTLPPTNTLNLNVCVNNASVSHTFVVTQ